MANKKSPARKGSSSKSKPPAKSGKAKAKALLDSRLSFITIGVKDFKTSLDFYKETLGLKLYKLQGDIAMFDMGGSVLALYPLKLLAEDASLRPGSGFGGIALAYNVRLSKDVDRVLESLQSRSTRILKPAEDTFWGGRSGYFADPDGYPWEVAWNPFIKMDKKGRLILGKSRS
ncbi:MAG: VOC family protein [Leptospirales bacterium]|nr:VOC family protein [Leptospirales bacterium]